MERIYLVGSLRNPAVQDVASELRSAKFEVFDDWQAAGPEADDYWQRYEQGRGRSYIEALRAPAAQNVYQFDLKWLAWCTQGVLVLPAGKSAHMELAYLRGLGKPAWVLLDKEPERWDVMLNFATGVVTTIPELVAAIRSAEWGAAMNVYKGLGQTPSSTLQAPTPPPIQQWSFGGLQTSRVTPPTS